MPSVEARATAEQRRPYARCSSQESSNGGHARRNMVSRWMAAILLLLVLVSAASVAMYTRHLEPPLQAMRRNNPKARSNVHQEERLVSSTTNLASIHLRFQPEDGQNASQPAKAIAGNEQAPAPSPSPSPSPSLLFPPPMAAAQIPRLIHQSWKSTKGIPAQFVPWMRSWVDQHPDWQYVFWTDADNLALFQRLYPRYLRAAKGVGKIGLADMARYALLHHLGGLYADADFECTKPFDKLHEEYELFLGSEPLAHAILLEHSSEPAICNALMASAPGHPFWLRVLESIKEKYDKERRRADAVSLTGPRIVKYTRETYFATDPRVTVLAPDYFYPEIAYWNVGSMVKECRVRADREAQNACAWITRYPQGEFTARTHASHHWQCSWCRKIDPDGFTTLEEALRRSAAVFRPTFVKHSSSHGEEAASKWIIQLEPYWAS